MIRVKSSALGVEIISQGEKILYGLGGKASFALREYLDICAPYFHGSPRLDPKLQWVLTQLALSCHLTSESALILIGNYRLWDTELLIRSVLEGTLKFIFLCIGDEDEPTNKVNEYLEDLPGIKALKRHQHIQTFLSKIHNPESKAWLPFRELLL